MKNSKMEHNMAKVRYYEDRFYNDFNELPNLFEIKLGYNLIHLVHDDDSPLLKEIKSCRNRFYTEFGVPVPKIRIRDK